MTTPSLRNQAPLINTNTVFVFDLDDTLYKEIDFLQSGFKKICSTVYEDLSLRKSLFNSMIECFHSKGDALQLAIEASQHTYDKKDLLNIYREHHPEIALDSDTKTFLEKLKEQVTAVGLISDGRSSTQRLKIEALGLRDYFDLVLISEELGVSKPDKSLFQSFIDKFPTKEYVYLANDPIKDFVTANTLGWSTIALLDNGRNIHKQEWDNFSFDYHPKFYIKTFEDLNKLTI